MKIRSIVFTAVLATAILCFAFLPAGKATVSAQSADIQVTIAQLQAQIQILLQQIAQLQAQQNQQNSTVISTTPIPEAEWCHTFNQGLGYVNSGSAEVGYLHTALDKEGISYSPDTGNTYDEPTMNAVTQFQQKYGIYATGYFGSQTRVKMNALHGCSTTISADTTRTDTIQSSGQLNVSVDGATDIPPVTQPTITVTSPNGGETWKVGETHNITWTSTGLPSTATLSIGINGDGQTSTMTGGQIATNVLASAGSYSWTIPAFLGESLAGKRYSTYATCLNCSGSVGYSSNNYSTIAAAPITDTARTITPSTTSVVSGTSMKFNFTYPSNTARALMYLSCPAGITDSASVCNNYIDVTLKSEYSVTFNNSSTSDKSVSPSYYVYLPDNPNTARSANSANVTVKPAPAATPSIQILSPNGGETLTAGGTYTIRWQATNLTGSMGIDLVNDTLGTRYRISPILLPPAGSYSWSLTASSLPVGANLASSSKYKIHAYVTNFGSNTITAYDYSDNYFTITQPVAASCPATSINGYSVPATISGASVTVNKTTSISNGVKNASIGFTCYNGTFTAGSEIVNITCNAGYSQSGSTCVVPVVDTTRTITPSATSIASGGSVKFSFTYPSNTVRASIYLSCPSGITDDKSGCNNYADVTSKSDYTVVFSNTSSQSRSVSASYYVYLSDNPSIARATNFVNVAVAPAPAPISRSSITVTSPVSGQLQTGATQNITWTSSGVDKVNIYLVIAPGDYTTIAQNISASTGTYSWTIPSASCENQQCSISIYGLNSTGSVLTSADGGSFNIAAPVATICTNWTYSAWSTCANGQQTRTVSTSSPANCTGGSPVLSQSCTRSTIEWQAADLSGTYNWSAAGTACANQGAGWRLPTKTEWSNNWSSMSIQLGSGYWSSDLDTDHPGYAFAFDMPAPYSTSQNNNFRVRCVQNASTSNLNLNNQSLASISDAIAKISAEIQAILSR